MPEMWEREATEARLRAQDQHRGWSHPRYWQHSGPPVIYGIDPGATLAAGYAMTGAGTQEDPFVLRYVGRHRRKTWTEELNDLLGGTR